jgi:hypothetical protein
MDNLALEIFVRSLCVVPSSARYVEFKSFEYFRDTLYRLFRNLYNGYIGGEFIEVMQNLITGQIVDAYVRAWNDEGGDGDPPAYLNQSAEQMVNEQQSFVEPLYKDIVDARVNETSFEPFMMRADMWANRYKEAQGNAVALIEAETGGKQVWTLGATEKHCPFCSSYNGIVAFVSEWITADVHPQNAPNHALTGIKDGEKGCEGWLCDCRLASTDKRRSPKALDRIMNIALQGVL